MLQFKPKQSCVMTRPAMRWTARATNSLGEPAPASDHGRSFMEPAMRSQTAERLLGDDFRREFRRHATPRPRTEPLAAPVAASVSSATFQSVRAAAAHIPPLRPAPGRPSHRYSSQRPAGLPPWLRASQARNPRRSRRVGVTYTSKARMAVAPGCGQAAAAGCHLGARSHASATALRRRRPPQG